jgi:hypothetical protein
MSLPFKQGSWAQGIYEQSDVQLEKPGALRILEDGRKFRYACSGAAVTVAKAVEGSDIVVANGTAQGLPTISANALSFTYTWGGAVTYVQDYFMNGFVQVTEGTGLGQNLLITNSAAVSAGTTAVIRIADPLLTATDTANSKGTIMSNEYRYVITAATITNPVLGLQVVAASAANKWGWVQTGGPAVALITGTPAIGSYLIANATDGSLGVSSMAATSFHVGYVATVAGATGKYYPVVLTID